MHDKILKNVINNICKNKYISIRLKFIYIWEVVWSMQINLNSNRLHIYKITILHDHDQK